MLTENFARYLREVSEPIPGWMSPYAGEVTAALLEDQKDKGVQGPVWEIGVYGGKYLSVLYESARSANSRVIAVDPFEHFSPDQIVEHLRAGGDRERISFQKTYSTSINVEDVRAFLRAKSRFVSLDGSHDAPDVAWDLRLAYETLHPQGIISVDDFLNTECLGVIEAVSRFLDTRPNLAPFLFTSNKLFLAPLRAVAGYKEVVLAFARANPELGRNKLFVERHDHNPVWGSTEYHGHWLYVV